jgi:hypothetical protein
MANEPGFSPTNFIRGQITSPAPGVLDAPENIIMTVPAAKAIYFQYRLEHLPRIELYAHIEGLIAGNPPYSPTDLAAARLSHIANFNNLEARSFYEQEALALWNLVNSSQYLVNFELISPAPDVPIPDAAKWGEIMSRHWTTVVREWPSFNVVFNTLTGQLVKLGVSVALWPDEHDWRWKTVELSRFFVQDQAQTDISLVTCVCVESIFTAQYLMEVYMQIKDKPAGATPWDKDALAQLLLFTANDATKQNFQIYDAMDIQRHIQNGDTTYNQTFTDNIKLVSMFSQEYDGKITHYIFHPYFDFNEFVFKADRQYESMDEGVTIFTMSPGEFTIHSNLGLGHKIYSAAQATMQLDCSVIDMAKMSATLLIQTVPTGAKDVGQIRIYPGVPTDIGTATVVRNQLGENISQVIAASQYTSAKIKNNLINSGDDPMMPDKSQGSLAPSDARARDYKEFGVLKNVIAHFYTQFDNVVRNMTTKMYHSKSGNPGHDQVMRWKELCINDGVPEIFFATKGVKRNQLPPYVKVKAARAAGDGSLVGIKMALQDFAPMVSSLGPKGRLAFQRMAVIADFGPEYIETFLGDSMTKDESRGGASLAGVENAVMQMAKSPVFSLDNEHEAHFVTHMALGELTIQAIQQQQTNAIEADKIFSVLIPHMMEHWQAMAQNIFEQDFIKQMKKPWDQLSDYARLNRKNAGAQLQAQIKKEQEQQQQTQQAMTDEQLATMKAVNAEKRADMKISSQLQRADEANKTRADIMKEKVTLDADTNRLKVRLEAQNKSIAEQDKAVENMPLEEARSQLTQLNGITPAPYDIEPNI